MRRRPPLSIVKTRKKDCVGRQGACGLAHRRARTPYPWGPMHTPPPTPNPHPPAGMHVWTHPCTHEVRAHALLWPHRTCRGQASGASGELDHAATPSRADISTFLPPGLFPHRSCSSSVPLCLSFSSFLGLILFLGLSLPPPSPPGQVTRASGPASLFLHPPLRCRGHLGQMPRSNLHLAPGPLRARA